MIGFVSSSWNPFLPSYLVYRNDAETRLPPVDDPRKLDAVAQALYRPRAGSVTASSTYSPFGNDATLTLSQSALAASASLSVSESTGSLSGGGAAASQESVDISGQSSFTNLIIGFTPDGSILAVSNGSVSSSFDLSITATQTGSSLEIDANLAASEIEQSCGMVRQTSALLSESLSFSATPAVSSAS